MKRGTTPTITLTVDMDLTEWTCYVAFATGCKELVINDDRLTKEFDGTTTTIQLTLTQDETLGLRVGCANVQIRAIKDGTAIATDIETVSVGSILQDGVIDG